MALRTGRCEMALDVAPLRNAVARLREGLARYRDNTADTQIRDGLIQRFEFTYELSHRMLKRFLMATSANASDVAEMSFADLIRTGNQRGVLLGNWPAWRTYREMRSKTSHAYDEDIALEVVNGLDEFLQEVEYLAARLYERAQ